jgi:hypothetical protein
MRSRNPAIRGLLNEVSCPSRTGCPGGAHWLAGYSRRAPGRLGGILAGQIPLRRNASNCRVG